MRRGLPLMWRDGWWRMFDRDPLMTWVYGRIALLGDAARRPPAAPSAKYRLAPWATALSGEPE